MKAKTGMSLSRAITTKASIMTTATTTMGIMAMTTAPIGIRAISRVTTTIRFITATATTIRSTTIPIIRVFRLALASGTATATTIRSTTIPSSDLATAPGTDHTTTTTPGIMEVMAIHTTTEAIIQAITVVMPGRCAGRAGTGRAAAPSGGEA